MIINPSYKAELREAIREIDEMCFTKDQKDKILSNDDLLDMAAVGFQKMLKIMTAIMIGRSMKP